MDPILQRLNDPDPCNRLTSLAREVAAGPLPTPSGEVNNHIHTIYSFSPYSPAAAAWMAAQAGLKAAGIMDHDSLAGAEEMIEACKVLGIASTIGFELRVDCSLTRLNGRKINNPDSTSIAYVAIHGIPRSQIPAVARFLRPIQQARNRRNEAMTRALNKQLPRMGLPLLDFDRDVYQQSQAGTGGSITERHLLAALAQQMITSHGRGEALVTYLAKTLAIPLPQLIATALKDQANTHYLYDVLGVLKSTFLPSFFIQPGPDECIPVRQVIEFARTIGAIPAYAYLGDVTASPTGDKKAEHFEDEYLDLLFEEIVALGFRAVTYMPPRNSLLQLQRVQRMCQTHGLMEISGVDINSSRQSFRCPEILRPEFNHLIESTWALIAHEKLSTIDSSWGIFSPSNPLAGKSLSQRLARYAGIGASLDPRKYDESEILKHATANLL